MTKRFTLLKCIVVEFARVPSCRGDAKLLRFPLCLANEVDSGTSVNAFSPGFISHALCYQHTKHSLSRPGVQADQYVPFSPIFGPGLECVALTAP